jgi:hypothetical protein
MSCPTSISNTRRQAITASCGSKLHRQYLYLPKDVWSLLSAVARSKNTSISKLIESFALGGKANSKELDDSNRNSNTYKNA